MTEKQKFPWKCIGCGAVKWAVEPGDCLACNDCSSFVLLWRHCTRCGERYYPTEFRCPKCHNPEFSLTPVVQTDATERGGVEMAKRKSRTIPTVDGDPSQEAVGLLGRIEEQETHVRECERKVLLAREELKFQKEQLGNAMTKLRGLAAARSEDHPLFDQAGRDDDD